MKVKAYVGSSLTFSSYQEFPRPVFTDTLHFPDDITTLTGGNVSELLGKYTKLFVFANAELCKWSVRLLRAQTAESLRRAALLRQDPSLNVQERWRRDAVLDCDAEIVRLTLRQAHCRAERDIAQTARDNFEKYIAALSRELSRKGYEHKN